MSERKTSYQGKKRVWGRFRCPQCNRTWNSGNSWANCRQECMSCDIMVYPYHQRPLKRRDPDDDDDDDDVRKPHMSDLCEKCRQLGYNCRTRRRY